MCTTASPNSSYGLFSDFPTSFKRWFFKGYRAELKGYKLEHVLNGTTKQPISLYDFRYYLQNKEHTAENLEFHYWYQDYKRRFAALAETEKAKSPPLYLELTPDFNTELPQGSDYDLKRHRINGEQPFRKEIDATIKTFFNIESLKELCLDASVAKYTVYCASETTHPDVFEAAYMQTYAFMADTSFKNFIHNGLQNARYHLVVGELTFGCVCLALIPMTLLNTFAMHMSRWTRMFVFGFTFFFFMCLLAGRTGICVLRCLLKKRQVPDYLCDEYVARKRCNCKVEVGDDVESNNKKAEKSLTSIIDNEVVKYSRQMVFHIVFFSLFVATIVTVLAVSITNENDPLPMLAKAKTTPPMVSSMPH